MGRGFRRTCQSVGPAYGWLLLGALLLSAPFAARAGTDTSFRIGVYDNPPLVFLDQSGQIDGFLPALFNDISTREGWKLDYVHCEFPRCLAMLDAGDIDLLIPIAVNADRLRRYRFNRRNFIINWGKIFARDGLRIESIRDLDGKRVAVVSDDIHYRKLRELADAYEISIDFRDFSNYDQVLDSIALGHADAGLATRLFSGPESRSSGIERTPVIFNPVGLRLAMPGDKAGGAELVAAIDRRLGDLKADPDSIYYGLLEEWLDEAPHSEWPGWFGWALLGVIGSALAILLLFLIFELVLQRRTRVLRGNIEQRDRSEAEEQTLGVLLRLSLEGHPLEIFLQQSLDSLIHAIPWLEVLPQAGIFVATETGEELRLVSSHNLAPEIRQLCAKVPFGQCLCGRAALEHCTQFANCVDDRHVTRYPGMAPHGHYNVPIMADNRTTLGAMVFYVPHGHAYSTHEQAFLEQVADVLSMGISKRRDAEAIERLAYFDPLTGLANRRLLLDRLQHDMQLAARHSKKGAVLFFDLDRFKTLNDALGHAVGDELLRQAGRRLVGSLRAEDSVARIGGDEFVVVLPELGAGPGNSGADVRAVADKLRRALAEPFELGGHRYQVTASIGISLFPDDSSQSEDILRNADAAMYKVKHAGGNGTRFFEPGMQKEADHRLSLESQLRDALDEDQLSLSYQPLVQASGDIVGAEVLLRWDHPVRGPVPPASFVPVAEETGLILHVGRWVMRQACLQLKRWMETGECQDGMRYLAINVSPIEFRQNDYVNGVASIIEETGVDSSRITIEITEGALLGDLDEIIHKMRRLKRYGLHLSIDDFGTGYSSLTYLKRLPLDILKIDRSFVRDISTDAQDAAIVETIISITGHLGLEAVAEGVETEDQFEFLKKRGCHVFQGFHFGRPVTAEAFFRMICSAEPDSRAGRNDSDDDVGPLPAKPGPAEEPGT
ncbi:MAG: EAL domain-containing protein [Pseudomonadota bacterium]|nr:EAL domain-containing protein [Pseudomonadota bacterium]